MSGTIFALATPPGRSAVAVVRASGEKAGAALEALAGPLPPPRHASLRAIRDPASGEIIDRALVLWFPGPSSETGEDMAEFQLHGGRAVVEAVLAALGDLPGLVPAGPGDFARRAFAHGKLDLTAAEGLADLVAAETEGQRRQALRQLAGELGAVYDGWRDRLIGLMAGLEAAIDFPDEDLPADLGERIGRDLLELSEAIAGHLVAARPGERMREGFRIAILGPPNVGKSSLLNRLAGRAAAIVAPTPGTTRDVIEVPLDLGGFPVLVADTAGLREGRTGIEREGIRRARAWAADADLKILMSDSEHSGNPGPGLDSPSPLVGEGRVGGEAAERRGEPAATVSPSPLVGSRTDTLAREGQSEGGEAADRPSGPAATKPPSPPVGMGRGEGELIESVPATRAPTLLVWNKADLHPTPPGPGWIAVSCLTGQGLDALVEAIRSALSTLAWTGPSPPPSRARHRAELESCMAALARARSAPSPELMAEDLRLAARSLGRLTGRIDVSDVLDAIFAEFCIGK